LLNRNRRLSGKKVWYPDVTLEMLSKLVGEDFRVLQLET
jgi:hypothetical protein